MQKAVFRMCNVYTYLYIKCIIYWYTESSDDDGHPLGQQDGPGNYCWCGNSTIQEKLMKNIFLYSLYLIQCIIMEINL